MLYKVCSEANVSQGNLTLFLRGDLSKLSLDKCRALNDVLTNGILSAKQVT